MGVGLNEFESLSREKQIFEIFRELQLMREDYRDGKKRAQAFEERFDSVKILVGQHDLFISNLRKALWGTAGAIGLAALTVAIWAIFGISI